MTKVMLLAVKAQYQNRVGDLIKKKKKPIFFPESKTFN